MHIDWYMALAGLIVGFTVGLTGMGGGALMTPILVLLFKIQPLAAVSSDLVAAVVMKPVGGGVHLRHGTVNKQLVKWLMIGSIPSAFLGIALIAAAATMSAKAYMQFRRIRRQSVEERRQGIMVHEAKPFRIRKGITLAIGIFR